MALDLQWPLSRSPNGRERVVEQGSIGEVQQGVDMTFHVPAGHLRHDVGFGRDEYAFSLDATAAIEQTIDDECQRVAGYEPIFDDKGTFTILVTAVVDPEPLDEVTL